MPPTLRPSDDPTGGAGRPPRGPDGREARAERVAAETDDRRPEALRRAGRPRGATGIGPGRPAVVREADAPWDEFSDPVVQAKSPIRWKLLVGAERTPSRALTVGTCEIPPGASLLRHHHAPGEVYYVLEGEGVVEAGDLVAAVGPGTALYIPPNAPHRTRNTGARPLRLVWIFPTDGFGEITYHYDE